MRFLPFLIITAHCFLKLPVLLIVIPADVSDRFSFIEFALDHDRPYDRRSRMLDQMDQVLRRLSSDLLGILTDRREPGL